MVCLLLLLIAVACSSSGSLSTVYSANEELIKQLYDASIAARTQTTAARVSALCDPDCEMMDGLNAEPIALGTVPHASTIKALCRCALRTISALNNLGGGLNATLVLVDSAARVCAIGKLQQPWKYMPTLPGWVGYLQPTWLALWAVALIHLLPSNSPKSPMLNSRFFMFGTYP
jgi:hypothetical protein